MKCIELDKSHADMAKQYQKGAEKKQKQDAKKKKQKK